MELHNNDTFCKTPEMPCPAISAFCLGNSWPGCWQRAAGVSSEAAVSTEKWLCYQAVQMCPMYRSLAAAQWKREGFCKNVRNVRTFSAFLFKFFLFLFFLSKSMLIQMNAKLSFLPEVFQAHSMYEGPNPMLEVLTDHWLKILLCFIFPKLIH